MDSPGEGLDAGVSGAAARGLRPAAALTISEWAETYRMWAGRSVAEAGRYRSARTPYIREPLDCLSEDSPVQRLVCMKAARLGFSEGIVMNVIGYYLHHSPAPCLLVLPTLTMAQRVARESLEPMLQATPELPARLGTTRGRGELRSTLLMKEVPNGSIALVGANSAAALRQTAAKIVLVDELDACPRDVEGEGSPLAIAEARARTFGPSRKVVLVSSPTEKGRSLIEAEFLQTDQRRYEVPCPFCEVRQELTIDGLSWEPDQPETARYLCVQCRTPIDEGGKPAMVAAGTWRATARSDPRRASVVGLARSHLSLGRRVSFLLSRGLGAAREPHTVSETRKRH
jgi:phage terminase large subunit GpA-like protein